MCVHVRVSEHECMSVSVTSECGCRMHTHPCVNMNMHECACKRECVHACGYV